MLADLYRLPQLYSQTKSHPDFDRIPAQKWRANSVELSTNAQFVTWPVLEEAVHKGVLTRLVVSCNGDGTADDYERLRPPSRWSRLIEFLQRASALRDRINPKLELMTRTNCTAPEGRARWHAILDPRGSGLDFPAASLGPARSHRQTARRL